MGETLAADAEVLTDWVRRYREPLKRYVAQIMPRADAEDIVQDVFLRLSKRPGLGEIEAARHYVYRTASNVAADWLRKHVRHGGEHDVLDVELADEAGLTPEQVLIARQELSAVFQELTELPERTQRVFRLYHLSHLAQKDVASHLGVGLSTVEAHMTRANRHLRSVCARSAA